MKTLVCKTALFDLHQNIFLIEDNDSQNVAISTLDNLSEDLVNLCYAKDTDNIHLFGNEDYISKVIQQIHELNETKYSNKDIKVEVN